MIGLILIYIPLQLTNGYVETDENDNDDIYIGTVLNFKDKGYFYTPHHIDMLWDWHAFDLPAVYV